jgi:metal-responsive CopG/Arc/MetJ family transcriptional regulator
MSRVKVSVTVDPDMLHEVDKYVGEREGLDRSKVVDEALALWLARRQDAAMEEQFSGGSAPPDEAESWRSIRRAAAARRLQRS